MVVWVKAKTEEKTALLLTFNRCWGSSHLLQQTVPTSASFLFSSSSTFIPYFAGLLRMYCRKGKRPLNGTSCSSKHTSPTPTSPRCRERLPACQGVELDVPVGLASRETTGYGSGRGIICGKWWPGRCSTQCSHPTDCRWIHPMNGRPRPESAAR